MTNLFKKAMVWTDLHLGLKSNGIQHNQDCWEFTKWMCDLAQQHDCDVNLFLGDFHNNRNTINVVTLNYGLQCLEHVADRFDQTIMIPGNHDIFYRDNRNTHSVSWAKNIPKLRIINEMETVGDCVFVPWMVGDDHKQIVKQKGHYMFGHFELPNFLMNAMVRMPEVGELRDEHFTHFEKVFTGHFHKRQLQSNINYIGNCFPHNFSDAGDDDRGCMILEWGREPQFHAWPGAPKYRVFKLSEIIQDPEKFLLPHSYVRLILDVDISYEEANFIKETFVETYQLRELSLISTKQDTHSEDSANVTVAFESVDHIVNQNLMAVQSEFYDPAILMDLYKNL
jgi:DNA repair exonuclease SbcCD nuclease subunit